MKNTGRITKGKMMKKADIIAFNIDLMNDLAHFEALLINLQKEPIGSYSENIDKTINIATVKSKIEKLKIKIDMLNMILGI